MSVNSYLTTLSSELVLSTTENTNIKTSIATLSQRLNWHFNNGELHKHFQFGSNTRGTILPRRVDSESDVDYMVVFKNPNGYKPETLLKYLKDFMHKYYSKSEIYKDSPTMVLELNHIKFELVPAIQDMWGNLSIPSRTNFLSDWMSTDPTGFNQELVRANTNSNSKIKPAIRLLKYWNTNKLNYYYSSFLLEKYVVDNFSYPIRNSVKEYVFDCITSLNYNYTDSQSFKNKLDRAKQIINNTREYERQGYLVSAESEIKKLFPKF
ncbi:SMODS domain-containing nucleotidyltransferase [Bacillus subtilis]|uniref:SMODS domain-containing nucleotidyltransferase n=1 Tax=Bacillus subtilis TaxID=1423 RepID=UPI00267536C0|nr:nucleotidyltransferase [Bacillus subtilis]MDO3653543.1 nucleotidyltransferase [Bacillus subtilis]